MFSIWHKTTDIYTFLPIRLLWLQFKKYQTIHNIMVFTCSELSNFKRKLELKFLKSTLMEFVVGCGVQELYCHFPREVD